MGWSKTGIMGNKWQLSEAEPTLKQRGGDMVLQSQAGATLSSPHSHARYSSNWLNQWAITALLSPPDTGDRGVTQHQLDLKIADESKLSLAFLSVSRNASVSLSAVHWAALQNIAFEQGALVNKKRV